MQTDPKNQHSTSSHLDLQVTEYEHQGTNHCFAIEQVTQVPTYTSKDGLQQKWKLNSNTTTLVSKTNERFVLMC